MCLFCLPCATHGTAFPGLNNGAIKNRHRVPRRFTELRRENIFIKETNLCVLCAFFAQLREKVFHLVHIASQVDI